MDPILKIISDRIDLLDEDFMKNRKASVKKASNSHMLANHTRLIYCAVAENLGYDAASAMIERKTDNEMKRKP